MKKIKPIPRYYLPGFIRLHLIDNVNRGYIVNKGYVTTAEAENEGQEMMQRSVKDKYPFTAAWLSQDITPVY